MDQQEQLWEAVTAEGASFQRAAAEDPGATLLVFDFDGTLAPIVARPEDARALPESLAAISKLADRGFSLAVISGRPVGTLLELLGEAGRRAFASATLYGHYGAEHLDLAQAFQNAASDSGDPTMDDLKQAIIAPPVPEGLDPARVELEEVVAPFPGAALEEKGLSIAAHFRGATSDEALQIAAEQIQQIAERHGLTVEAGRKVWELRGPTETKGDALRSLVDEVRPANVAFAGDDVGDLAAFEALGALDVDNACAVVSSSTEVPELDALADILCRGPQGIAAWLGTLAEKAASYPNSL